MEKTSSNRVLDYMARDYDSFLAAMRREIPEKLPEWTDHRSEADFGNVLLELFAHMGDIISYYQDRIANESFLGTARERRSVIEHLKLISYSLSTAAPASTALKISVSDTVTGDIRIRRGDAFATKSSKEEPSVRFEYNGPDIQLNLDAFELDPGTGGKFYEIPVEEGRLITDDIVGVSDGTANQRFHLSFDPLILRSVGESGRVNADITVRTKLETESVPTDWTIQESLAFSREGLRDCVIETDEDDRASLLFGDDTLGAIPPSGAVVSATYRVGGGKRGNVAAGAIDTIADAPALSLLGATVTNMQPATGGAERETIEQAVQNAPRVFRSLRRAVTAEDYKSLALNFQGVAKVRAEVENWNKLSLYVAPDGGGRVSDILTANLLAYFEDKRPLSTLIEVRDVDYVKIYVSGIVGLESYYSKIEMSEKIQMAAANQLAFENVDFGHTIYLSKFYEAIEAIEGVAFVTLKEFHRDGEAAPDDGRIVLAASEIPRLPGIAVEDPIEDGAYTGGMKLISVEGGY
jgi:hypothetical protein